MICRWTLFFLLCVALPATGISSGAMRFDGVDDYINLTNSISIKPVTHDYSIFGWMKTGDINDVLFADRLSGNVGTQEGYVLYLDSTGVFVFVLEASDNSYKYWKTLNSYNDNKWHHVGFTWSNSGNSAKIYVDNVEVGLNKIVDTNLAGKDISNSQPVMLGLNPSLQIPFNGSIDEVLIYNKSLTASEIAAMYASGGAWYPRNGLVSRWAMDDNGRSTGQAYANGATIRDSRGSNNGTVSDGADGSMTIESSPTRQKRGRR